MSALEQLGRTILLCRDYVSPHVADAEICGALQSFTILIRSDIQNLRSHSGQTVLVTLALLASRMGMQVLLDVPEIEIVYLQPPLQRGSLRQSLIDISCKVISGSSIRPVENADEPDVVFVLGNTPSATFAAPQWRLSGQDSSGYISRSTSAAEVDEWDSNLPVGGMVAAALAAGEAFKLVMQQLRFRNENDREFFASSPSCAWDFGSLLSTASGADLGQVDVISGGAISQAALYALLRVPQIQMRGRVFDDDVTGPSNMNRNMLSFSSDVGRLKVETVAERCSPTILLTPVSMRFPSEEGRHELSHRVLVGVDNIPNRWAIQRAAPGWLAVSGTTHFNVSSSSHRPGEPCAGCLHSVDDPDDRELPTVSFVSFWAGLAMAVRLVKEVGGIGYLGTRQHLWLTPLRVDLPHAGLWTPVAPIPSCPVGCPASAAS